MANDNSNTDYQQGNVIAEMRVTKLPNGMFKATSMGLESNHFDSAQAVRTLQDQLQESLLRGDIRPEM